MFPKRCARRCRQSWMTKILIDFLLILLGKGVQVVAVVYATLIVKGKKNYADVPTRIKEQVKEILIDLDCGDLVTE